MQEMRAPQTNANFAVVFQSHQPLIRTPPPAAPALDFAAVGRTGRGRLARGRLPGPRLGHRHPFRNFAAWRSGSADLTTRPCQPTLTAWHLSAQTDRVSEATHLAAAAAHDDPEIGLAAVVALRQLLDQLEALQVASAREHGWTWERIAAALGITRQSVHKKYATRRLSALPGRRPR